MQRVCASLGLAALLGCSARPSLRDDPTVLARGRALALEAAAAHGGLERWHTVGGVRLHLRAWGPYYPRDADYLFDPARNRAVARFADGKKRAIEWRYDGTRGTLLQDGRCTGPAKTRAKISGLLSNLLFWFGVPFKFLDEGASQHAVDADRFLVTYHGVGDTPDDWFLVRLARDRDRWRRVAQVVYVASGFTKAIEFEASWEDDRVIDGLLVGMRRRVRPKNRFWRLLAPRVEYEVTAIALGQPLDDAAFAPPPECR